MVFGRRFDRLKKLPKLTLRLYMLGKILLLVGVGALLASYLPEYDWQFWGWVLVVVALLLKLPGFLKLVWK